MKRGAFFGAHTLSRFFNEKFREISQDDFNETKQNKKDVASLILRRSAGTLSASPRTFRRLPFPLVHHPSSPSSTFAYYLSLSFLLGYAHLLLIVCKLTGPTRVSIYPSPPGSSKGTLCHGAHNAFFPPSPLVPSLSTTHLCAFSQAYGPIHTHTRTCSRIHTHSRIAYVSDAVFVAYAFPVLRHPSMRVCIRTAFVACCCFSSILAANNQHFFFSRHLSFSLPLSYHALALPAETYGAVLQRPCTAHSRHERF